jgi:hypothetical protein
MCSHSRKHSKTAKGLEIFGILPPIHTIVSMKIANTIMTVIGWAFVVIAIVSAFGFGSIHMHFGPLDFKLPVHAR